MTVASASIANDPSASYFAEGRGCTGSDVEYSSA